MIPFFVYWCELDASTPTTLTVALDGSPFPTRSQRMTAALATIATRPGGFVPGKPEMRAAGRAERTVSVDVLHTAAQKTAREQTRRYYAWIMMTSDTTSLCACKGGTAPCTIAAPGCINLVCLRKTAAHATSGKPCSNPLVCACRRGAGALQFHKLKLEHVTKCDAAFSVLATLYAEVVYAETGAFPCVGPRPTDAIIRDAFAYATSLRPGEDFLCSLLSAKVDCDTLHDVVGKINETRLTANITSGLSGAPRPNSEYSLETELNWPNVHHQALLALQRYEKNLKAIFDSTLSETLSWACVTRKWVS